MNFPKWRSLHSTSGFGFGNFPHLRRYESICRPNFDYVSESTAEILLLPVSENKSAAYWNSTSGSDFDLIIVNGVWFYVTFVQTWLPSAELRPQFYFRFPVWWCPLFKKVAVYLQARYLNPRLRYFYFRFLKTNGRHIGILHWISVSTSRKMYGMWCTDVMFFMYCWVVIVCADFVR